MWTPQARAGKPSEVNVNYFDQQLPDGEARKLWHIGQMKNSHRQDNQTPWDDQRGRAQMTSHCEGKDQLGCDLGDGEW